MSRSLRHSPAPINPLMQNMCGSLFSCAPAVQVVKFPSRDIANAAVTMADVVKTTGAIRKWV